MDIPLPLPLLLGLDSRSLSLLFAGLCVIATCHVTTQNIMYHFHYWTNKREQTAIFYIVLMVPIFAVDSYVALAEMPSWEVPVTILDSIKECYEAFVIANFLTLMYSYMGVSLDPKTPLPDSIKGRVFHHSFPVSLFQPHEVIVDRKSLQTLKNFTSQFIFIRPLFSVILCFLEIFEFDVPPFTWIISVIFNVSVYLAIYALLLFYHTFDKELAPHNPLGKFLCIKGVVFFAFWQGLIIKLLAAIGVIHKGHFPYSVEQIEEAMQNFIICFEMLIFSFLFLYAFNAKEYDPTYEKTKMTSDKKKKSTISRGGKKRERDTGIARCVYTQKGKRRRRKKGERGRRKRRE